MSRRVKVRRAPAVALTAALALALLPAGGVAQSLIGTGGFGSPVSPVDARARALGNVGIGLPGASILPTDPASAADLVIPAVTFTARHSWVDVQSDAAEPDASGTRFPVVGVAYPVGSYGMATLTFGSVLDQRWESQFEQRIDLGGGSMARVTDRFVSDGGVNAVRIGFARRIAPSLAVGVSAGRHIGDVSRVFTRRFDSLGIESNVQSFSTGGRWSYGGATVTGGAAVDVADAVRLSGSVTWSAALDADPDADTEGRAASFDLPLEFRVGATGVLAPGLSLTVAVHAADWSDFDTGDAESGGTSVLDFGAGLEWREPSVLGRTTPFRVGYRRTELPFLFDGEEVVESAWTGGIGLNLVESGPLSLAQVDLAVENGERSAPGITESFWRASVSLRVAGF